MPIENAEQLQKYYNELQTKRRYIDDNEEYVRGKNTYIMRKEQEKKPDNRIPIPMAKMAVEDMCGYAGRAGDIKTEYDLTAKEIAEENDPFIAYMRDMDSLNDYDIETSELYNEVQVQGESYELWWVSDDVGLSKGLLTAEYKIVPNAEIVIVYTNDIKKKKEMAIHFIEDSDEITADVYYPKYSEQWYREKNKSEAVWKRREEGDTTYPYDRVPVIHFKGNRRCMPLFQAEKPLIDAYDELLSKSVNEVDRFNAAITLLGDAVDKEFVEKLKTGLISVIDDLNNSEGTNWPTYLEKNLGGVNDFYNQLADRIERLFHKSVKIPDMTDENFAGNQSGVAIAFKLIGMEFKASQIETYFNRGLRERLEMYADVYNASTAKINMNDYEAKIRSKRNIPVDIEAKARIAQMLAGILSEETLIKMLPKEIVEDAAKEIEKKKEESPAMDLIEDEEDTDDTETDAE